MHTLVISEKPSSAARIAEAIDEDARPYRRFVDGIPVFECSTKHGQVTVCSAIGHLYTVASKGRTPLRYYPVWDFKWRAKSEIEKASAKLAKWIRVISSLANDVERFVNACDFDIEGAVIGYTLLHYACSNSDRIAHRMKFSTMTIDELQNAYRNLSPHLDHGLVDAGLCRHEIDWSYGINISRLLTQSSLKQSHGYTTLSTGRVQGPTMQFIVTRENEINSFIPIPFWSIDTTIDVDGTHYMVDLEENPVSTFEEAERIVRSIIHTGLEVTDVQTTNFESSPPYPFDLSNLQSEAYRIFHYTPTRTLAMAEKLYLDALISYPRTSSQKLPRDIDYGKIFGRFGNIARYRVLARNLIDQGRLQPRNGPKSDSAHPAIYPTGNYPKGQLNVHEYHIFDLVVKRFLASFAGNSVHRTVNIVFEKNGCRFFLKGSETVNQGWREYYAPFVRDDSRTLPPLHTGEVFPVVKIEAVEKFTRPPVRYNPSSLLQKMEEEEIGTKATRAEIIRILYERSYIENMQIKPTKLGRLLVDLLQQYCPTILDVSFTSKLDRDLQSIEQSETQRKIVLVEALEHLRKVMLELFLHEEELGSRLSKEILDENDRKISLTTPCPECNSLLKIVRNRMSGKRFLGCSNWKHGCKFKLPLPQYGSLRLTSKKCEICNFQLIEVRRKSRKPVSLSCPRCYVTQSRQKQNQRPVGITIAS
jgi:DNA topoisomerase-1